MRVTYSDSGGNTIGAEMNKLKRAYRASINQAKANGDLKLAAILEDCLGKICAIDSDALEAIVRVQETQ